MRDFPLMHSPDSTLFRHKKVLFILMITGIWTALFFSPLPIIHAEEWKIVRSGERYSLSRLDTDQSGPSFFKVNALMTGTIAEAKRVLLTIADYASFVPQIATSEVLSVERNCITGLFTCDLPWIGKRCCTAKTCLLAETENVLKISVHGTNEDTDLWVQEMTRITQLQLQWEFRQLQSDELAVDLFFSVDPNSSLPRYFVDKASGIASLNMVWSVYYEILKRRKCE